MDEKNSFDILLDYPKQNRLNFESSRDSKRFYLFPEDPLLNTKYIIFKKHDIVFVAYDSYAAKAFMNRTFCGVYSPIESKSDLECKITQKYFSDFILKSNKKKTSNKIIDSKLTITSNSNYKFQNLIDDYVLEEFYKLNEKISPIELLIQNDYLQFVKEFNNKKIIGVETNQWIYKHADIEILIDSGSKLINKLMKPAANSR